MTATYPLNNPFLNIPGNTADPRTFARKSIESKNSGLNLDQKARKSDGPADTEEDSYHLGRLIYTL